MTKEKWLEKLSEDAEVLREFVAAWHPSAREPRAIQRQSIMFRDGSAIAIDVPEAHLPITAPQAELACRAVREKIRCEKPENPLEKWDRAIASNDAETLISLLNDAWFGVPESTSCWSIPGFKEAVDLIEDPWEDTKEDGEEF